MTTTGVSAPQQKQATCPTCGEVVASLLALCWRTAECIRAAIADDHRLARLEDL